MVREWRLLRYPPLVLSLVRHLLIVHSWPCLGLVRWEGLTHFLKGRGGSSADHSRPITRGLYMHGGVGVGKTMLMDMFARSAPQEFKVGSWGPVGQLMPDLQETKPATS